MQNLKGIIIFVIILALLATIYFWSNMKDKDSKVIGPVEDFDGEEYEGTMNYVGDYNSYTDDKGRFPAYKQTTSLYKVVTDRNNPANILKYEYNKNGKMTMMKTNRFHKKGAQIKVLDYSLAKPVVEKGVAFVQLADGSYVNLKKISKV